MWHISLHCNVLSSPIGFCRISEAREKTFVLESGLPSDINGGHSEKLSIDKIYGLGRWRKNQTHLEIKCCFFLKENTLMVKYETPLSTLDLIFIHFCIVQFTTSNDEDSKWEFLQCSSRIIQTQKLSWFGCIPVGTLFEENISRRG